jgi:hypothetical protein
MIAVHRDAEGIEQAARELLEESRAAAVLRRIETMSAPEQRASLRAELLRPRSLPAVYYARAGYLDWLSRQVERGIELKFYADEVAGLDALERARGKHERDHPPCPGCGNGLDYPSSRSCAACGWAVKT